MTQMNPWNPQASSAETAPWEIVLEEGPLKALVKKTPRGWQAALLYRNELSLAFAGDEVMIGNATYEVIGGKWQEVVEA